VNGEHATDHAGAVESAGGATTGLCDEGGHGFPAPAGVGAGGEDEELSDVEEGGGVQGGRFSGGDDDEGNDENAPRRGGVEERTDSEGGHDPREDILRDALLRVLSERTF
jgi:hypothetical protein